MRARALDSQGAAATSETSLPSQGCTHTTPLDPAHQQSKDIAPGTIACQNSSTSTALHYCPLAQTEGAQDLHRSGSAHNAQFDYEQEGDQVAEFDQLCEVQSDKASVEITSQYEGTVRRLLHTEGDIVQVCTCHFTLFPLVACIAIMAALNQQALRGFYS